jgi:adenosylhomocysteine nucleosidase
VTATLSNGSIAHGSGSRGVAILFALEREASPFRKFARRLPGVAVHVTGVGRQRARIAAQRVIHQLPRLVVAAGFCGALVPELQVGDIVTQRLLTVDRLVSEPAEKRRLAEAHQAVAVDMESAAVAEVCAEYGVPCRVVRAVSDTVDTALSPDLVRLLSGGRVSAWQAVRALMRTPSLVGEFRRLARDTRLAARNLADALVRILSERPASVGCS